MDCVVFLVGEGPSDVGWLANEPSYQDRSDRETGLLPPIIRRVAEEEGVSVRFEGRKLSYLGKAEPSKFSGPLLKARNKAHQKLVKKASAAAALADSLDADALVFVTDADKTPGGRSKPAEGRKRRLDVLDAVQKGLEGAAIPTVAGVPLRMIEAWALGDREAVSEFDGETPPKGSPEQLWGAKDEPASNYPKHVLERVLGEQATAELLADIGESADLDALAKGCPESFWPFLKELRKRARECARKAK